MVPRWQSRQSAPDVSTPRVPCAPEALVQARQKLLSCKLAFHLLVATGKASVSGATCRLGGLHCFSVRPTSVRLLTDLTPWRGFSVPNSAGRALPCCQSRFFVNAMAPPKGGASKRKAASESSGSDSDGDGPAPAKKPSGSSVVHSDRVREIKGGDIGSGPIIYWYSIPFLRTHCLLCVDYR